jgi:5'-methylthioadenosine nucleosidase
MLRVKSIVVIMAMRAESEPLVQRLGAVSISLGTSLPVQAFQCEINNCLVTVVENGRHRRHGVDLIGTDGATISAMFAMTAFDPDLVITAGTAGGRRSETMKIGDVVLARDRFVYHDRRIPLSGFQELGVGSFPALPVDSMAAELGYQMGVISTGNSFGETVEELVMLEQSGAIAVDMESASVAAVCEMYGVPVTGIRVISNFMHDGDSAATEFEQELQDSVAILAAAVEAGVRFCVPREVAQLGRSAGSSRG